MNALYVGLALVVFAILFFILKQKSKSTKGEVQALEKPVEKIEVSEVVSENKPEVKKAKADFSSRLEKGLEKTRTSIWQKVFSLVRSGSNDNWDEAESILYSADLPVKTVEDIMGVLKSKKIDSDDEAKKIIFDHLNSTLNPIQEKIKEAKLNFTLGQSTQVVMIVGVNGAGKTTTIGKIATQLKNQGAKVLVGACDTFRAAAVDQLQVWCDRAGVDMIRAKDGADPSGVAYDTVARAYSEKYDFCLIDTAGRLHTNSSLMDELSKMKRVMTKVNSQAPHQTLLVLDAIVGQNALKQAQEFNKALNLTGLIFTKCDGSAKAGSAVGIMQELTVPVAFIGVGEDVEDLDIFKLENYLSSLLGIQLN